MKNIERESDHAQKLVNRVLSRGKGQGVKRRPNNSDTKSGTLRRVNEKKINSMQSNVFE